MCTKKKKEETVSVNGGIQLSMSENHKDVPHGRNPA